MRNDDLHAFVQESNRIENIFEVRRSDVLAHEQFLKSETNQDAVSALVYNIAGAVIRNRADMNVRVGEHVAPRGGPKLVFAFDMILAQRSALHPADFHQKFLYLHPYMDGNGRAGRAIWLKTMIEMGQQEWVDRYGFLRAYYYQSLELADRQREMAALG